MYLWSCNRNFRGIFLHFTLTGSFLTPSNVTFLKFISLETLYRCLIKYTARIKLLSDLAFTLTHGSGSPVAVTIPGQHRTLQIFLTDSLSRDLNSSIELIYKLTAPYFTWVYRTNSLGICTNVLFPIGIQYKSRYYQSTMIYSAYEIER